MNNNTKESNKMNSNRECVACYGIPRSKIFQCINGHSICELCSIEVKVCPTCRSPGVGIRNRLAESLLDDMQFECTWSSLGCTKTSIRSEISAHENQCDQNPNIIKFCSIFANGESCQYKFTLNWLAEPENLNEFIDHIKTCHEYVFQDNIQYGNYYASFFTTRALNSLDLIPSRSPNHYFRSKFYRLKHPNEYNEILFFRIILLKADSFGNKILSWAFVQLTQAPTTIVVKISINRSPNSKVASQFGQQSSPTICWTLKPINLARFIKMIQETDNLGNHVPFPFSLSVSFLSKYYVCDDGKLYDTVSFQRTA